RPAWIQPNRPGSAERVVVAPAVGVGGLPLRRLDEDPTGEPEAADAPGVVDILGLQRLADALLALAQVRHRVGVQAPVALLQRLGDLVLGLAQLRGRERDDRLRGGAAAALQ